ncbi:MAG: hypothetical protein V1495_10990 [Pseudomonadota bacterium]
MEVLRRSVVPTVLVAALLPFAMGNKGCEGTKFDHPAVATKTDCTECHTEGMSTKTKPPGHDVLWMREHGRLIRRFGLVNTNYCVICHSSAYFCNDCHQQTTPQDHNQFFRIKGHGLQVGFNRTRCETCHHTDFCERCHSSTRPMTHTAGWGSPLNRHCVSCHYPLESVGGQGCATCHRGSTSHALTPRLPANAKHGVGVDCRTCHTPLRHTDNGTACEVCHARS